MNNKMITGMVTFSFILIIAGGVSSFVLGLKKDQETILNRINYVNDEFEIFSTNSSVFENYRNELYNVVLSNVYYDTMYDEDKTVKNKLSNYENLVDQLTKNTKKLNRLCEDVYYPDSKVNTKCSNYKLIYEQVINYFVSDINVYNENVKKYNEYQKNNNSDLRVDKYKTTKEYIDYNNDNEYDGKE